MRSVVVILALLIAFSANALGVKKGEPLLTGMHGRIILCGQSANSGTRFLGPSVSLIQGLLAIVDIGSAGCNALGSDTEATADAPITSDYPALKVTGMWCTTSSNASNDQVFTARSAEADLTPSITCTVPGNGTGADATACISTMQTTINVAAGATIAIEVVNTEDLSAEDVWCELFFSLQE